MITIERVEDGNSISLEHYELPIKQMIFSGHPRHILTANRAGYDAFVIKEEGIVIGIFALDSGIILQKIGATINDVYLRGLSINHAHQGQGKLTAVIPLIENYVKMHMPLAEHLYLTVNVKNEAYYAFIKLGFIDQKKSVRQNFQQLKVLRKEIK
ncbi:hypothetical protein [Macrococcus armenti]|uniref:GNAT family N-acetyltransferase n=1 Tax=Macrococcus armenti TaxID=2875764 RepID=A0ABY3ZVQ2_9STAP|nr:hypothetical protein [Macrococcus armenti]UOB20988.1 hypothetical protein MRZ06_02590 [Macrococcus armenti]